MVLPVTILCSVISIIVSYFVVYRPLVGEAPAAYFTSDDQNQFYTESIGVLEMITDLEADFRTGKISEHDYEELTLEYKRRYLEVKSREEDKSK